MKPQHNNFSGMDFINHYEVDSVENSNGDTFLCMLVPADSNQQNVSADAFAVQGAWTQMTPAVLAIDSMTGARAALRIKIATSALAPIDERDEAFGSFELCSVRRCSDVYYRATDVSNFYRAIACARISERLQHGYSPEIDDTNRCDGQEFLSIHKAINALQKQYGPYLNLIQLTGIDGLTEGKVPASRVRAFLSTLTIVSVDQRHLASAL